MSRRLQRSRGGLDAAAWSEEGNEACTPVRAHQGVAPGPRRSSEDRRRRSPLAPSTRSARGTVSRGRRRACRRPTSPRAGAAASASHRSLAARPDARPALRGGEAPEDPGPVEDDEGPAPAGSGRLARPTVVAKLRLSDTVCPPRREGISAQVSAALYAPAADAGTSRPDLGWHASDWRCARRPRRLAASDGRHRPCARPAASRRRRPDEPADGTRRRRTAPRLSP